MEEQLVHLLTETQASKEEPRKNAEWQLRQQYTNPQFPVALVSIGSHSDVPIQIRQAALLFLKTFVLDSWSDQFDEFKGHLYSDERLKAQIRHSLLELSVSGRDERKVKSAASLVVSKIASADFPSDWPDLLPTILNILRSGTEAQLHGALKVLGELVDDCFNDEQFFQVARELVSVVYGVAVREDRKATLRALAVSVFRSCFDTLEMVLEDHKVEVKAFAEETLSGWIPFFTETLKTPLPPAPTDEDEEKETDATELWRGAVALKLQVVKTLMRIRGLFPSVLSPHSPALFSATWQELSTLQSQYHEMYITDDRQGRLEDADGLPYTLDFLILEELDFMQACLRAPPVRKELQSQLQTQGSGASNWVSEVMKIAVAYAHITTEEEGLWDVDVNVFLSEEVDVTANYTPRTACGDLVGKLGEWLERPTVEGLLSCTQSLYSQNASWKAKEAALYLLDQYLGEIQDVERKIGEESSRGYIDCIQHAMQEDAVFLRARGFLVAGNLSRTSEGTMQQTAASFMTATLKAINEDPSEIVRVASIRALQYYLSALPRSITLPQQQAVIGAMSGFLEAQDFSDLEDSDDLLIAIIETLRDAVLLDTSQCLTNGGIDLLFTIASRGATNFQIALMISETFEEITSSVCELGAAQYAQLTSKVLPSLMGAFDVASLTEENALANLAAELLSNLAANSTSPMPPHLVSTVMPRLNKMLLGSMEDELLKSATSALKEMLKHDPEQVFAFQDQAGKGGLEVVLIIVDRLLNPVVDDHAAAEVGGLAAEVVEKAGAERLGPYLQQLLRAVAARLATATQAQFIQSLVMVFARLSLVSAQEVIGFLADIQVGGQSGLQTVMAKWLESSVIFAGYDEIRQNIAALSKLYELHDSRLANIEVKGDLIVPSSDRIITRSRARQNPEQYTMIPAQLKIIRVFVGELLTDSASEARDAAAAANLDDGDDEDGDWEDDPTDFLDLGSGMTKSQLMSFGAEDDESSAARQRDDETQRFLLDFFRRQAQKPEFAEVFNSLSQEEQEKLRSLG